MSYSSAIEWTDATWNPLTGCTKISEGCLNCYAEKLALRLKAMGSPKYKKGFLLTYHEKSLKEPLSWKKPKNIFVNSMSDTFHENVSDEIILNLFKIMNDTPQHQFQVLTKRSKRLQYFNKKIKWTSNIWLGVTVENQKNISRVYDLQKTDAKIKFISFEPLIGPISDLDLSGIDWVIVGGESGIGSRIMEEEWVDTIYEATRKNHIPFFFKQWGGRNKKIKGNTYKGKQFFEIPK
jgi:protein gp37